MGRFFYDSSLEVEVDDRALFHMQLVIVNKLRRQERFCFTLEDDRQTLAMWLAPDIAIEFVYAGNREPAVNRAWLEMLALMASSNEGLRLFPEPPEGMVPDTIGPVLQPD